MTHAEMLSDIHKAIYDQVKVEQSNVSDYVEEDNAEDADLALARIEGLMTAMKIVQDKAASFIDILAQRIQL